MSVVSTAWYFDPTFLPAAFGLLGVVVGGLITAGSTFFLEERREQRQREKEEAASALELKRAARMIEGEFKWARSTARFVVNNKRWPLLPVDPLTLDAWLTFRSVVAPVVSNADWIELLIAASDVAYIKKRSVDAHSETAEVSAEALESAANYVKAFESALNVLMRLTSE